MGNTKTTAQSDASENQKQGIENNANPTEGAETTIKSKAMGLLLALQMAVGGSGVANAGEPPQDQTKITPPGKELVVNQDAEKEIINFFLSRKGGQSVVDDYNSLSYKDKADVINYYTNLNGKHPKAVVGKILTLKAIDEGLKNIAIYNDTGKIPDMTDSIKSGFDFWIDFDPDCMSLFTKKQLEFFEVIDKTLLLINETYIANTKKETADIKKETADIREHTVIVQKQIEMLKKMKESLLKIGG